MENHRVTVAVWAVQMLTYLVIQYSVSESRLTGDSYLGQKEQILMFMETLKILLRQYCYRGV